MKTPDEVKNMLDAQERYCESLRWEDEKENTKFAELESQYAEAVKREEEENAEKTRIKVAPERIYLHLTQTVELENLYVGQRIDIKDLYKKVLFFSKFSNEKGMYVVDTTYKGYGERGLHYFLFDTVLELLKRYSETYNELRIENLDTMFTVQYKDGLYFEPVEKR